MGAVSELSRSFYLSQSKVCFCAQHNGATDSITSDDKNGNTNKDCLKKTFALLENITKVRKLSHQPHRAYRHIQEKKKNRRISRCDESTFGGVCLTRLNKVYGSRIIVTFCNIFGPNHPSLEHSVALH